MIENVYVSALFSSHVVNTTRDLGFWVKSSQYRELQLQCGCFGRGNPMNTHNLWPVVVYYHSEEKCFSVVPLVCVLITKTVLLCRRD